MIMPTKSLFDLVDDRPPPMKIRPPGPPTPEELQRAQLERQIAAMNGPQGYPPIASIGRFNPSSWDAFLAQAPMSENLEDRRSAGDIAAEKTPPGYFSNLPAQEPEEPEQSSLGNLGSLLNHLDQQKKAAGEGSPKQKKQKK
jgi:hypothetical protein